MATTVDGQRGGWTVRRLTTHGRSVTAVVGARRNGTPLAVTAGDDGAVRAWGLDGTPSGYWRSLGGREAKAGDDRRPTTLAAVTTTAASVVYCGWTDGSITALDLTADRPVLQRTGPPLVRPDVRQLSKVPRGTPLVVGGQGVVQALAAFVDEAAQRRVVAAYADGAVSTWPDEGDESDEPSAETTLLHGLRVDDQPVVGLAVSGDPRDVVYGTTVDNGIIRWSLDGSIGGSPILPSSVLAPGEIRLFALVTMVATPGGEILVRAIGKNLELVRTTDLAAIRRMGLNIASATAMCPTVVDDVPAVAVGGSDGRVELVGAEQRQFLAAPIEVGEPVSSLQAVRHEGRQVLLVGGARGGVYVVEPSATVVTDAVELQDDLPGQTRADDRLRRSPLAEALAVRLRRRHEEGREASFLVHLDGRWGSGKTTVLNFVAGELGDGWTIVRYNAWRQARVGPPWWTLLTALRSEMMRRRSWPRRAGMWCSELLRQRIRRASGLPATILLLLAAAAVFFVVRPRDTDAGDTLTTVQGVAAAVTALATLFAGAQFVARFFGWHSPRGAKAFEDLDANPMDRVAAHFAWLVRCEQRPIAFFVDDIDRCSADHIVELLEAVQTLVRDAADSNGDHTLSPCFVVAGDGAWIRNAFEEHYADFADQIAEPGRPLGYLFLAKIFQLTLPLDRVSPIRQARFFRELLGLEATGGPPLAVVNDAREQVERAPDDDAQQQVLAGMSPELREAVAPVAVRRQTEKSFAAATEHRLTGFASLLPDNPRAVKRFLNAFALTRSVRTVEGQVIPTGSLALWTILEIRWPLLADTLSAHPDWVVRGGGDSPALPPQIPEAIRALLDGPDVQEVLNFADGGPLTPDLIVACRGG